GKRGLLIAPDLESAVNKIENCLLDKALLRDQSIKASEWSQQYTLELFESEIKNLIVNKIKV
ncbi:glycosyltransferase family 1 protein, partial [Olleya sp. Ti.3.14]